MKFDTYNSKDWETWKGPKLLIPPTVLKAVNDGIALHATYYKHLPPISPEAITEFEKTAKFLIDKASIFTRTTDRGLKGILADGRVKNQFETGYSKGSYDPPQRRDAEYRIMGVPHRRRHKNRPIYGYLSDDATVNSAMYYGPIVLKLKHELRFRATFTGGDSLGGVNQMLASPIDAPDYRSWSVWSVRDALKITADKHPQDLGANYLEVQIHNGVSLSDVEYLHFNYSTYGINNEELKKLETKAKEMGMKVV